MRPALQPSDVTAGLGPVPAARPASGGDVAQLGERLVRNEEVVGSIPIISTISGITVGQAQRNPDL